MIYNLVSCLLFSLFFLYSLASQSHIFCPFFLIFISIFWLKQGLPIEIKAVYISNEEVRKRKEGVGAWLDWLSRPFSTKSSILEKLVAEPLMGLHSDLLSFSEKTSQVHATLMSFGCHESDHFNVDLDDFSPDSIPVPGQPHPLICRIQLKEDKRLSLGAQISAEGEQAVGETSLKMTNYFGELEKISGSYSVSQGQTVYNLSLEKPLLSRKPYGSRFLRFGLGNSMIDNAYHSSHTQSQLSSWLSIAQDAHSLTYEALYRNVQLTPSATEALLAEGGPSIKSSIKYSWNNDQRDDRLIPTKGRSLRFSSEFAGLLGDTRHLKLDGDVNYNVSLSEKMAFQWIARAGALFTLGTKPSHIADRFFFGGMNNPFYGFKVHGAGPRLAHDSYGGDFFWTTGIHTTSPLIETPFGKLYSHAFAQAGNCVSKKDWKSLLSTKDTNNPIRFSTGAGLSMKTAVGLRLDLTYALPLSTSPHDLTQQIGFGVSFNFA